MGIMRVNEGATARRTRDMWRMRSAILEQNSRDMFSGSISCSRLKAVLWDMPGESHITDLIPFTT